MIAPLDGVIVLDLTEWIAGPYATRLLADYGARVIKVERPTGDPSRGVGPYRDGAPGIEHSGTFFYFNTNKESVVLDLRRAPGREALGRLACMADVVVEGYRPGVLDRLGVGWAFLRAQKRGLSLVSISNFGQESPYRDYRLTDLVLFGLAGEMFSMGVQDREPLKMYGTAAMVECGAAASTAILAALTVSEVQGIGQHVDFALSDAQFNGVDRRHAAAIGNRFSGRKTLRMPGPVSALLNGVYPCLDGYVDFTSAANRMDRVFAMLGNPEWTQDPRWQQPGIRFMPDMVEEFNARFLPWLFERTKREVWEAARSAKVLCGPLFTVDDLFHNEQFRRRGYWVPVAHPSGGTVDVIGPPIHFNGVRPTDLRPAPRLGAHSAGVLREAGYGASEVAALAAAGAIGAAG